MTRLLRAVAVVTLASGCNTVFQGKPKIPNGRLGCTAVCDGWGMELAGMVQMGEYSDGCICRVKGKDVDVSDRDAAASALGPVAGVFMQMQREQQQASENARPGQPGGPGGHAPPGGYTPPGGSRPPGGTHR